MSFLSEIENDLSAALSNGLKPCRLTIADLSTYYRVSSTSIRAVLLRLINDGKLVKLPNGRLAINSTEKSASKVVRKKSKNKSAEPRELILRDIVNLSLLGREEFLREETTAKNHQISRAAVREIFLTMVGQGILEHIPRRGWRVRPFSRQDLHSYNEVREVMEIKALELASDKLADADLQRMLDGNIPGCENNKKPLINNDLHGYIIQKAENFYISDFFKRHAPFYNILFEWEGENPAAAEEAVKQHRAILTALLKRDFETAKKELRHHIHENHSILNNLKNGGMR